MYVLSICYIKASANDLINQSLQIEKCDKVACISTDPIGTLFEVSDYTEAF